MSHRVLLGMLTAGLCVFVAGAASGVPPQQVSPAGLVEASCPTFSWSLVAGAAGYELLVYEVLQAGEVGKEPLLSMRLPGGAGSWTPPGAGCLAAGGRYAWTLRVVETKGEGGWAESVLFEVAAVPSMAEVEAALATLRRHLGAEQGGRLPAAEVGTAEGAKDETARPSEAAARRAGGEQKVHSVTAAAAPSLGTPSLTVDANVALGAASNLFKDGAVFLWDDTDGNTALGRLALASATGTATGNTAFGREALRYTEPGAGISGSFNTAMGDGALRSNTIGFRNPASGSYALASNTTGRRNTASGVRALYRNTTGQLNTAIGQHALYWHTTGHENTAVGNSALFLSTTGYRNTAVGAQAGTSATTGSDNIFLGSAPVATQRTRTPSGSAATLAPRSASRTAPSSPGSGRSRRRTRTRSPS